MAAFAGSLSQDLMDSERALNTNDAATATQGRGVPDHASVVRGIAGHSVLGPGRDALEGKGPQMWP